jgi:hypothetical protein
MLTSALGEICIINKPIMKPLDSEADITGFLPWQEKSFKGLMVGVISFEKMNEIQEISVLKCPVFEVLERFQVLIRMVLNKFKRRIIHQLHQLQTFTYDCFALTPG